MSTVSQTDTNVTVELQNQELLRTIIISGLSTLPTCVFLFINGIMLFTMRSKPVFRETCRYVLLYNLLFSDTAQLAQTQVIFLVRAFQVQLPFPVCAILILLVNLTGRITPLTLVVMPLERYIAVCYPLRHATIVTLRNTGAVIIVIWAVSSLNNVTRLLVFFEVLSNNVENLGVINDCSNVGIILGSKSEQYDTIYTCCLFVSAGVAVIFSYVGVIVAARSVSTDKSLARKACNTLLLNVIQLILSLSANIYNPLIRALSRTVARTVFLWVRDVFYVCFIILPRCLTSLIYGLRDQTIRPVLIYYLCCRMKTSVV
ncbi:odorant receptor 131-2-like [Archocentrus centrarchus]|uniref:odorant receptor 131-2-like n=1 Tax=Archocentrus centrarchus TaxID=63155 RepID=UPI0011EA239F|nr:odorant receptor 131-2-like [Archocentrus centrarchus]